MLWAFAPLPNPYLQSFSSPATQTLPGLTREIIYSREFAGFRSLTMRAKEKSERTIRIVSIGGSTTDQSTQNTSQMWTSLLGEHLQEPLSLFNLDIEIAAWGRPGKRIYSRAAFCDSTLMDYSPDVVLTLEGINDLALHGGPGYNYDRNEKLLELERSRQTKMLRNELIRLSQILRRLKLFIDGRKQRRDIVSGKAVEWHSEHLPARQAKYRELPYRPTLTREPDPILEFEDGLRKLLACVRAINAQAIVVGQPVLWKPQMSKAEQNVLWFGVATPDGPVRASPAWLSREMKRYNEVQRRVAAENDVTYVDLDSLLPKGLGIYFDDCHFTDWGSRRVALELLPFVRKIVERVAIERALIVPERDRELATSPTR